MSWESSSPRGRAQDAAVGQLFEALKQENSDEIWFLVTALAIEQPLGWSVLRELGLPAEIWNEWRTRGILQRAGDFRPLSLLKDGPTEPAFELCSGLRWRVLRHAHALGLLAQASLKTEALLEARSRAPLIRKLMAGSLIFRPQAPRELEGQVRDCLRASLLEPFDADFLTSTWKARTPRTVGIVLSTCLTDLHPCAPLYEWAMAQPDLRDDPDSSELLISMGLHRLEQEQVLPLLLPLETASRTGFLAALRFVSGDVAMARQLVRQYLQENRGKIAVLHGFTPLLFLLRITSPSQEPSEKNPADLLRIRGATSSDKSIQRALRTFVRFRDEPKERLQRLDPHQLSSNAPAWEILLLGLTAYAFTETSDVLRAVWADCLTRRGVIALERGYYWMGRQYLVLAAGLDRVRMERTLNERPDPSVLPITREALQPQPGDLADLVKIRAPWEVRLAALDRVTKRVTSPKNKHQLRWFVDASSGSVHRPGLLRHEEGRGYVLDRRLSWEEARAYWEDLGPEDRSVLDATACALESADFPHLEVFECLIGHPRVVDGNAEGRRLDVVRETCRIETTSSTEHLRIGIHPPGIGPGLNLVRLGGSRLGVVRVEESMAAVLEALPAELSVPQAEAARAFDVLTRLGETVPVVSPELDAVTEETGDVVPVIRFTPQAGAYLVDVGLKPFGPEGRFFALDTGPSVLTLLRSGRKVRVLRQFDAEKLSVSALVAACPTLLGTAPEPIVGTGTPSQGWILGEAEVLTLLSELRESTLRFHLEWPEKAPLVLAGSITVGALRGGLRSQKGWYLLSGSIALDEARSLTLGELSRLPFVHRGRYARLKNGDFAAVDQKVRALASLLSTSRLDPGGAVKLSAARLLSIQAALEGASLEMDAHVERRLEELEGAQTAMSEVPAALTAPLRPYQLEGLRWLVRLGDWGFGALLADDMGLGKTIQIIAYLLTRPAGTRHLVVAPLSVCTNWVREVQRFAPNLHVQKYGDATDNQAASPSNAEASRVTIVSYSQLSAARDFLTRIEWDTVTVDEAHYIKNPKTQRAQAILELRARHRLATTGTPVENHLGDLWGIFRFLNPDLLGRWSAFHAHFVQPIERDDDAHQRETLRQIVKPFVLRRTKSEVLKELPPLTIVRRDVHLSDDESQRYALLRRQIHEKLRTPSGKQNNKLEVLAEITRLRRFCCHPRLVFPEAPDDSAKLRSLLPLLEELVENGHRALVFSQYVDFLTSVRARLAEHELAYEYLDGGSSPSARQSSIDRFNSGATPLFLISLKAGGVGLNLTAADYVIHLDPWWNPAVSSQATDRAHRIGQERPVTVLEFVTRDTIEEDILRLHETKQELSRVVLDDADRVGAADPEDLRDWLSRSLSERSLAGLRQ